MKWASYCLVGLVQDCSNSIANTLELLQSYPKPSIYFQHCPSNVINEFREWISVWKNKMKIKCTPAMMCLLRLFRRNVVMVMVAGLKFISLVESIPDKKNVCIEYQHKHQMGFVTLRWFHRKLVEKIVLISEKEISLNWVTKKYSHNSDVEKT